ncbi:MAG: hypothetical protein HeimC3_41930 [Candidatus Heimdallarchaeota archaeon LC_3]|nr:MAG: hypothetical protein HeimC3_41930 [Candidatus Heimdallarchaeota archaeon LC_3]
MPRVIFNISKELLDSVDNECDVKNISRSSFLRLLLSENTKRDIIQEKVKNKQKFINNNLAYCNECNVEIENKIENQIPFEIPTESDISLEIHNGYKDYNDIFLDSLIAFLWNEVYGNRDYPEQSKEKIISYLLLHGQFKRNDIQSVFDKHLIKVSNFPPLDFLKKYPDYLSLSEDEQSNFPPPTNYSFAFQSCDYRLAMKWCTVYNSGELESLKCPDCGNTVSNTPDNVSSNGDLCCPKCAIQNYKSGQNIFGIVRKGFPYHHGNWRKNTPKITYSGTDYINVEHYPCTKSPNNSKKMGSMIVNGLYIDSDDALRPEEGLFDGRLIIGLECEYCGYRDSLKMIAESRIPVLTENGKIWHKTNENIVS